ncbi:hypothetical protein KKC45_04340 [Patescibacteria group bacterium]|nr:hypothetical protein [Patescibacteria group bacterium]
MNQLMWGGDAGKGSGAWVAQEGCWLELGENGFELLVNFPLAKSREVKDFQKGVRQLGLFMSETRVPVMIMTMVMKGGIGPFDLPPV